MVNIIVIRLIIIVSSASSPSYYQYQAPHHHHHHLIIIIIIIIIIVVVVVVVVVVVISSIMIIVSLRSWRDSCVLGTFLARSRRAKRVAKPRGKIQIDLYTHPSRGSADKTIHHSHPSPASCAGNIIVVVNIIFVVVFLIESLLSFGPPYLPDHKNAMRELVFNPESKISPVLSWDVDYPDSCFLVLLVAYFYASA